jgi:hypothetical protein
MGEEGTTKVGDSKKGDAKRGRRRSKASDARTPIMLCQTPAAWIRTRLADAGGEGGVRKCDYVGHDEGALKKMDSSSSTNAAGMKKKKENPALCIGTPSLRK